MSSGVNQSVQLPPARYYPGKFLLKCRSSEIFFFDLACKFYPAGFIAEHVDQHMPHFDHYLVITSILFAFYIAIQIDQS